MHRARQEISGMADRRAVHRAGQVGRFAQSRAGSRVVHRAGPVGGLCIGQDR